MPKTLDDWVKKFYPIAACAVKKNNKELLEHSLRKWKGATKENVEEYNCVYTDYVIEARYSRKNLINQKYLVFGFGYNTCALCLVHKRKDQFGSDWYDCSKCIIVLSGKPSCITGGSAYAKSKDNPSPMIDLLEKLLEKETKPNED